MQVHVICINDGIEFAVIDDKIKAEIKMNQLSDAYYDRNKFAFKDKEDYKRQCYWHIHTVNGF